MSELHALMDRAAAAGRTFAIASDWDGGWVLRVDDAESWHESFVAAAAAAARVLEPFLSASPATSIFDRAYASEINTRCICRDGRYVVSVQGGEESMLDGFAAVERWLDDEIRRLYPRSIYATGH